MPSHAVLLRGVRPPEVAARARRVLDLGFDGVGLEDPLHHRSWEALREALPRRALLSVRLFLPYPRALREDQPCPFAMGSLDAGERRDAIQQGTETILFADRHRIPLVRVDPILLEATAPPEAALERRRRLDAYRLVLARLLDAADRYQRTLAVTPGGAAGEAPSPAELAVFFREFAGAPLEAWPDTLRLRAHEAGGRADPWVLLEGKAAAVTLRDSSGDLEPAALGAGLMDWESLRPRLESCPLWMADPETPGGGFDPEAAARLVEGLAKAPEPKGPQRGLFLP
ncbi:MAG: hypothetical protein HY721_15780 [Planctomycetes bacterium]|nr:hypothetical protein [Planctomycetota bacterium]